MDMRAKIIFLTLLLASCALKPYKMDVQQGNVVTAEMRAKLKFGMTKTQVRYVLGTPMISDPFHENRWDYAYRLERDGKLMEQKRLTLNFSANGLQSIDDGEQVMQAPPVVQKTPDPLVTAPVVEISAVAPQLIVMPVDKIVPMDPVDEVTSVLEAWAEAWSTKDIEQYFASYADSFKPYGMSKAAWQAQRKLRISKPGSISVTLEDIKIQLSDETHASAVFTQTYSADMRQDKTHKKMLLEKLNGDWLIVAEQTVK